MKTDIYLRAWRLQKGLTQRDLAQRSGLTQAQVSRIEGLQQAPTLKTIEKLAETLGIKVEEFLSLPLASRSLLSRHSIQKVADSVVSGAREMGPELNRLADAVASLLGQELNAHSPQSRKNGRTLPAKFLTLSL